MFRKVSFVGVGALLAFVLAACGQQTASDGGMGNMPGMSSDMPMASNMASSMPMSSDMPMASNMASSMPMMDTTATTGGMDMGSTATSDAPYDARFIDSMIEHHRGAVAMAEQALQESERQEIRDLAQNIIDTQSQEIDQLTQWRDEWYPGLAPTGGMGMAMGGMTVGGDPSRPFDQRFITAMIAHHTSAIEMARDAQQNAERQEIKDLAGEIITAQEAEIAQMQQWQQEWFGS